MTKTDDVRAFNEKFGLEYDGPPRRLSAYENTFRVGALTEELSEYMEATAQGDLEKQLDALVDLVYFAIGTAHRQGFDFDEAFKRVHWANMRKVRSLGSSLTGRGSVIDVVKPEGWVAPDLSDLVRIKDDT